MYPYFIIYVVYKCNEYVFFYSNAASCKAVKHCIQTTWVTQKYPKDNDDICTICKNMVKEARDTLQSNVTLVSYLYSLYFGTHKYWLKLP